MGPLSVTASPVPDMVLSWDGNIQRPGLTEELAGPNSSVLSSQNYLSAKLPRSDQAGFPSPGLRCQAPSQPPIPTALQKCKHSPHNPAQPAER